MRRSALIILSISIALAGQARALPLLHGQESGINLIYNGGANPVALTQGYGVIDGSSFQLLASEAFTPTLTVGTTLVKNSVYYCYVVNGDKAILGTQFNPNTFSFACSSTGPTSDGHPAAAITGPNGTDGKPIFDATTSALFVGSLVTDPSAATFIPFYRNGQQVLLGLATAPAPVQPAPPAGFNNEAPYDPGVGAAAFVTFKPTDGYPETLSFAPAPFPLLSASAVVVDVHAYNYSTAGVRVCALDPNNHVIAVAGAVATEACQGQSYVNLLPAANDPSIHTYRANLNFDNTGKVYFGIAVAPPGNEVVLGPVYRGYLEPIKQLFAR